MFFFQKFLWKRSDQRIKRDYKLIDFLLEFKAKKLVDSKADVKLFNENDDELFERLIFEGNYVEYNPKRKNNRDSRPPPIAIERNKGKRNLKDIYDEFWEFINDNNGDFKEFIEKDKRRLKLKLGIN